jgi:hypothetical protein
MRRQIAALALATAALLTVTAGSAAAANSSVPAADPVIPVGDGNPGRDPAPTDAGLTVAEREAALMRGDRQAADLMGFMPSLYQGKWFKPGVEDVRRCITLRESHANYRASNGTYFGAYQMSEALADGAAWMMQAEVRQEFGAEGVKIVEALRKTTPNNWNRYWQDRAFWTIWRNGDGAHHWAGGSHNC